MLNIVPARFYYFKLLPWVQKWLMRKLIILDQSFELLCFVCIWFSHFSLLHRLSVYRLIRSDTKMMSNIYYKYTDNSNIHLWLMDSYWTIIKYSIVLVSCKYVWSRRKVHETDSIEWVIYNWTALIDSNSNLRLWLRAGSLIIWFRSSKGFANVILSSKRIDRKKKRTRNGAFQISDSVAWQNDWLFQSAWNASCWQHLLVKAV